MADQLVLDTAEQFAGIGSTPNHGLLEGVVAGAGDMLCLPLGQIPLLENPERVLAGAAGLVSTKETWYLSPSRVQVSFARTGHLEPEKAKQAITARQTRTSAARR